MSQIIYISGGARSGKSSYAQKRALDYSHRPIYLATARHWDAEFSQRIERHQLERDPRFTALECELNLIEASGLLPDKTFSGKTVLIDCVTLWLTNYFSVYRAEPEKIMKLIKQDVDNLIAVPETCIFISNEIGMGMHPDHETGRLFQDYQGWINQYIAQKANEAVFMVSGIPLFIKGGKAGNTPQDEDPAII